MICWVKAEAPAALRADGPMKPAAYSFAVSNDALSGSLKRKEKRQDVGASAHMPADTRACVKAEASAERQAHGLGASSGSLERKGVAEVKRI